MSSSSIPAVSARRGQYLLDLLAQVPDPRKKRGRRHPLVGLLAVGIAGSRSFAAIGQWAAAAGTGVLDALGASGGAAEESTFRRAFALINPDTLDRVLGTWLWTRLAAGRRVIAIDGKTVRGARGTTGKAPHLVAALMHGIGAVLGQVAVAAKSNEIPAVRDLLGAFMDLAGAVITIDAMHTQTDTAHAIISRGADYVMTVKATMPTLYQRLKKLPWADIPATSTLTTDHGKSGPAHDHSRHPCPPGSSSPQQPRSPSSGAPSPRKGRRPSRSSTSSLAPTPTLPADPPGHLGPRALARGKQTSLGPRRHLPRRQIPGQNR